MDTDRPDALRTATGQDVGAAGPSPPDVGTRPASTAGRRPAEAGSAVAVDVSTGAGVADGDGEPSGDVQEARRARHTTPRVARTAGCRLRSRDMDAG